MATKTVAYQIFVILKPIQFRPDAVSYLIEGTFLTDVSVTSHLELSSLHIRYYAVRRLRNYSFIGIEHDFILIEIPLPVVYKLPTSDHTFLWSTFLSSLINDKAQVKTVVSIFKYSTCFCFDSCSVVIKVLMLSYKPDKQLYYININVPTRTIFANDNNHCLCCDVRVFSNKALFRCCEILTSSSNIITFSNLTFFV